MEVHTTWMTWNSGSTRMLFHLWLQSMILICTSPSPQTPLHTTQTCSLSRRTHLFLTSARLGSLRQHYKTQESFVWYSGLLQSRPHPPFPVSFPSCRAKTLWFIQSRLPVDCTRHLPVLVCGSLFLLLIEIGATRYSVAILGQAFYLCYRFALFNLPTRPGGKVVTNSTRFTDQETSVRGFSRAGILPKQIASSVTDLTFLKSWRPATLPPCAVPLPDHHPSFWFCSTPRNLVTTVRTSIVSFQRVFICMQANTTAYFFSSSFSMNGSIPYMLLCTSFIHLPERSKSPFHINICHYYYC